MGSIPDQGTHWAPGNPLKLAQAAIGKAGGFLRVFHARQGEYVSSGHRALAEIDAALGELGRARQILVGELRDDQDQRAARVDRLIAENREQLDHPDDSRGWNSGPMGDAE